MGRTGSSIGCRMAKSTRKSTELRGVAIHPEMRGKGRGPAKGAPNAGRPPSIIRDLYRQAAADRLAVLTDIADGKPVPRVVDGVPTIAPADPADRMRAFDLLNKYGLGTSQSVDVTSDGKGLQSFTLGIGTA